MIIFTNEPGYEEYQKIVNNFVAVANKLFPSMKIIVVSEHSTVKSIVTTLDMPVHEIVGLLHVVTNRVSMLDIDDIRLRISISNIQEEQEQILQNLPQIEKKLQN